MLKSITNTLTNAPLVKEQIEQLNYAVAIVVSQAASQFVESSARVIVASDRLCKKLVKQHHPEDILYARNAKQYIERCTHLVENAWPYLTVDTMECWEKMEGAFKSIDTVLNFLKKQTA
jgi:hypothetical protein